MKNFSDLLLETIEVELAALQTKVKDPLLYVEQAIAILLPAFEQVRREFLKTATISTADEIEFFREIKPQWASKVLFYNDLYAVELNRPVGSRKKVHNYFENELQKLHYFFEEHADFYKYYRSANSNRDQEYFLRSGLQIAHSLDQFYFQKEQNFSTAKDFMVAQILAKKNMMRYLEDEITALKNKNGSCNSGKEEKIISWTGSKVSLVELIYALHTEGVVNYGNTSLKEVVTYFETIFNIDLEQYHRKFLEIRNRKSDRTKFLKILEQKLLHRMDEADEIK